MKIGDTVTLTCGCHEGEMATVEGETARDAGWWKVRLTTGESVACMKGQMKMGYDFKQGDYVSGLHGADDTVRVFGIVTEVDNQAGDGMPVLVAVESEGGETDWLYSPRKEKPAAAAPAIKLGDKVRIGRCRLRDVHTGKVGVVTFLNDGAGDAHVRFPSGEVCFYARDVTPLDAPPLARTFQAGDRVTGFIGAFERYGRVAGVVQATPPMRFGDSKQVRVKLDNAIPGGEERGFRAGSNWWMDVATLQAIPEPTPQQPKLGDMVTGRSNIGTDVTGEVVRVDGSSTCLVRNADGGNLWLYVATLKPAAPTAEATPKVGDRVSAVINGFDRYGRFTGKLLTTERDGLAPSIQPDKPVPPGCVNPQPFVHDVQLVEAAPAGQYAVGERVRTSCRTNPEHTGQAGTIADVLSAGCWVQLDNGIRCFSTRRELTKLREAARPPEALQVGDYVRGTLLGSDTPVEGEITRIDTSDNTLLIRLGKTVEGVRSAGATMWIRRAGVTKLAKPAPQFQDGDVVRHTGRKNIYRVANTAGGETRLLPLNAKGREHTADADDTLEKVEKVDGFAVLFADTTGVAVRSKQYPGSDDFYITERDAELAVLAYREKAVVDAQKDVAQLRAKLHPQPKFAIGDRVFIRGAFATHFEVIGVGKGRTGSFAYELAGVRGQQQESSLEKVA